MSWINRLFGRTERKQRDAALYDRALDTGTLRALLGLKMGTLPRGIENEIAHAEPRHFRPRLAHGEFQGRSPLCVAHCARVAASQYGVALETEQIARRAEEIQGESAGTAGGLHPVAAAAAVESLTDGGLMWLPVAATHILRALWSGRCVIFGARMTAGLRREVNDFVSAGGQMTSRAAHALVAVAYSGAVVHRQRVLIWVRSHTRPAVRLFNPWPTASAAGSQSGTLGWWGREAWLPKEDLPRIVAGQAAIVFVPAEQWTAARMAEERGGAA